MKTYIATGYQMIKNQNTWETERVGELISVEVKSQKNNIETIEGEISHKMGFDWFEVVALVEAYSEYKTTN